MVVPRTIDSSVSYTKSERFVSLCSLITCLRNPQWQFTQSFEMLDFILIEVYYQIWNIHWRNDIDFHVVFEEILSLLS